jgi:GntR family transcriptional regulator/MocR family aminotransferase
MRELNLIIAKGKTAHYLKIANAIREAIRTGQLKPGEALPSTRSIADSTGVHRHTVMAALEELIAEGWIMSKPRRAYRICETLPTSFLEAKLDKHSDVPQKRHKWMFARTFDLPLVASAQKAKFNFKSGTPDLRLFPHQEFKTYLNEAIRRSGTKLLGYDAAEGHGPFIDELKTYLRRMRALSGREIVVTHGSQEAIFLISQLLLAQGDSAVVEELGYPPAFAALRASGATLIPARVDAEGINPDHLETILQKKRIKLIYLTPLHQYPTTVSLSISRRLRVYELACRYQVPILEDDYDHEYHYRCQPLAPMASDDPAGLILYVSTFSKVFSPSARLGFMAIPPSLVSRISNLKRLVSRQNDLLMQDAVARWMRSGGFEQHLRRTRRIYEDRRNCIVSYLERARADGSELTWKVPDGGMAVWVKTKRDTAKIAERALALDVSVGHEAEYYATPKKGTGLRLTYALQTPAEVRQGLDRLLTCI